MSLEYSEYSYEVSGYVLEPSHNHSNNDLPEKIPLKNYVNRNCGQRIPSFLKFQKQMQLRSFDSNIERGRRQISYCDPHPPHDEPQEQMSSEDLDFEHETSLQRTRHLRTTHFLIT